MRQTATKIRKEEKEEILNIELRRIKKVMMCEEKKGKNARRQEEWRAMISVEWFEQVKLKDFKL